MEFGIKDILYIVGIVVSALVSFLGTRHKLKEYIRDKNDSLKDKIHQIEIKLNEQKAKDDLQQQVIDQIGKQMDNLIPMLLEAIKERKKPRK
jgi:mannitol-specific phosphotransferase system IIBC component